MAAPMNAPLAPFMTLADGMTIRITALDATTGATVSAVTVANVSIDVDPHEAADASEVITPTPLLVPADIGAG